MEPWKANREFLKAQFGEKLKAVESDQHKGVPHPPLELPYPPTAALIDLVPPEALTVGTAPLRDVINRRRSRRKFSPEPLTLEELSFLLWSTQGVQQVIRAGVASFRAVPSAGARHPFETYLWINRVVGLALGLYRYLPLEHKLYLLSQAPELRERLLAGCLDQRFAVECAVTFIWTVVPYRTEWRYTLAAAKVIALDAGHLCQNLYLTSEAIGAGTCAIGAYDQALMDAFLGVDGEDEFVIYVAPVGKLATSALDKTGK